MPLFLATLALLWREFLKHKANENNFIFLFYIYACRDCFSNWKSGLNLVPFGGNGLISCEFYGINGEVVLEQKTNIFLVSLKEM